MENLEYFIGKVCTVFTVGINRNYKDENPKTYPQPLYHYFMGRVLAIDSQGIFIEQWAAEKKKLKSYFFLNQVVGIAEEEQLNPNDPDDAQVISEIKEKNEDAVRKTDQHVENLKDQQQSQQFLDIEALSNMHNNMVSMGDNCDGIT